MKKNLLVTLSDKNYINQAKQLFSSVYFNAGWEGDYMLLAYQIPESDLKWFRDKGIIVRDCPPFLDYNKILIKYPEVLFCKLYLFTQEFKAWDQVIFLDADIIVKASLAELTKIKGLAGTRVRKRLRQLFLSPVHLYFLNQSREILKQLAAEYDLDLPAFNTGMFVFSTSIIQPNSFSKLKEAAEKYGRITGSGEESIINLLFQKTWIGLSPLYNFGYYYDNFVSRLFKRDFKAVTLHFTRKPWHKKSPFYDEWNENLKKAEQIDLNKIVPAIKLTPQVVEEYSAYFKKLRRKFFYQDWLRSIYLGVDKGFGFAGLFLKNNFPSIYKILKKIVKK